MKLKGCHQITERGLQYLCNAHATEKTGKRGIKVEVECYATDICLHIPSSAPLVEITGVSLLAQSKGKDCRPYGRLVIINDAQQEMSLANFLTENKIVKRQSIGYKQHWTLNRWQLSVLETSLQHVGEF